MEHFALGHWLLVLAYLTSVVGCALGLACAVQARHAADPRHRLRWLLLAAVSIGGVGIWLMHFVAMLGFSTPGMPVRYDIFRTALSAVLSVSAVFAGLVVVGGRAKFGWWRLALGGVITGLAVNVMHYTGMSALRVKGDFGYDGGLVALSVVIAVVAATAALWFAVFLDRLALRLLAGFVMGAAVTGMHYTGMAAVRMTMDMNAPDPAGAEVFSFLFPVFVLAAIAMAVPLCAVLLAPARGGASRGPAISPPYRTHSSEQAFAADQSVVDGGVPGGTFTGR
ncbi:MHYT domain-containing protein [Amycolatopsis tolypomycina]|uniref:MHYT domain-containing protein, NO-binding membrane sensor n=1 Tax=Amycolatopsis tolypomycina TaxID=208445 RepID=A0A1H4XGN2_9PSEU|nr:MHYT domain-containing protein [Amycolatopsis tolypomycina]SED04832.1 MHYT domain-containing protein, NO-binding membrane sensor [Amycolatopsis tolypomycina]